MRRQLVWLPLVALLLAACGGGSSGGSTEPPPGDSVTVPPGPDGPSLNSVLGLPGDAEQIDTPDVLVASGADFVSGQEQRLPLGLLHKDGTPFEADGGKIQVYLASSGKSGAYGPFEATYEPIAGPGIEMPATDIQGVYVAKATIPQPGSYYIAATYAIDGKESTASGGIAFNDTAATPAVGSDAPASETPTAKSTGGDYAKLTTANPPDKSLLEYSIADSLKAKKPFVAVFATPKFCSSRLCGPTVEIAQAVQKKMQDTDMRFIHVEIFKDNDQELGPNEWVTEWSLPTEPWIFVVGADGKIRSKFEGAIGADELEQAARAALS